MYRVAIPLLYPCGLFTFIYDLYVLGNLRYLRKSFVHRTFPHPHAKKAAHSTRLHAAFVATNSLIFCMLRPFVIGGGVKSNMLFVENVIEGYIFSNPVIICGIETNTLARLLFGFGLQFC